MKSEDVGRWRARQVTRFFFAIPNRDLLESLWTWRDELGIDCNFLQRSVEDRVRFALFDMSGAERGFYLDSTIQRQYQELRSRQYGAPFISPRDLCLALCLPVGERAAEMFGSEISLINLSMFFECSTPLAIVNHADVARYNCVSVDITAADWLDLERAYYLVGASNRRMIICTVRDYCQIE